MIVNHKFEPSSDNPLRCAACDYPQEGLRGIGNHPDKPGCAFNTKGASGDPEEVRQFKLMVCKFFGLPETFFTDVQNPATEMSAAIRRKRDAVAGAVSSELAKEIARATVLTPARAQMLIDCGLERSLILSICSIATLGEMDPLDLAWCVCNLATDQHGAAGSDKQKGES